MIRRLIPWLKWLATLAVAFFIGQVIYIEWHGIQSFQWRFDWRFLALSLPATSCWFFGRAYIWRRILARFGRAIPYRECMRVFMLSELSRYVPGTVWQYFSRAYLAGPLQVPASVAVSSALMELLLVSMSALALLLWHVGEVFPAIGEAQRIVGVAFVVIAGIVLQPPVLNRLARMLLPRLRLEYSPIRITFKETAALWLVSLLVWLAFGGGFVLFARGLAPFGLSDGLHVVSEYAASWLAGVVTIWAPGGIGVREGILGLLLGKILPLGTAFAIAVLSRIWLVLLELFWAAVSHFALRQDAPKANHPRDATGKVDTALIKP